jgi:hypothetical protein
MDAELLAWVKAHRVMPTEAQPQSGPSPELYMGAGFTSIANHLMEERNRQKQVSRVVEMAAERYRALVDVLYDIQEVN